MVVIYDCILTEPPSSVHCFRDVSLYSKTFLECDNLVECPKGTKTIYWKWLKGHGAHDFVDGLILRSEKQEGLTVGIDGHIKYDLINEENYINLIAILNNIIK
tara:strand:+ start:29 stop:337 length:309 start_codon:yes stop_codon:yes gene_type:complete